MAKTATSSWLPGYYPMRAFCSATADFQWDVAWLLAVTILPTPRISISGASPNCPTNTAATTLSAGCSRVGNHGPGCGVNSLTRETLPCHLTVSPALRCSRAQKDDHKIHIQELGRRGMHLPGHRKNIDDSDYTFSGWPPRTPRKSRDGLTLRRVA